MTKPKLENKKILILDDEIAICRLIMEILEDLELELCYSLSITETRKLLKDNKFDLLILDYNVSDGAGWSVVEDVHNNPEKYGIPSFLLMSGTVDVDFWLKNKPGVDTVYMPKPFSIEELRNTVIRLLEG